MEHASPTFGCPAPLVLDASRPGLSFLLAKWQRILRLQDWEIQIAYRRQFDMGSSDVQGKCFWTLSKKSALIKILDPADWDPDIITPQDVEKTVVHELLHLHMAPFDNTPDKSLAETSLEQAIECIASALVSLDRRQDSGTEPIGEPEGPGATRREVIQNNREVAGAAPGVRG